MSLFGGVQFKANAKGEDKDDCWYCCWVFFGDNPSFMTGTNSLPLVGLFEY